MYVREVIFGQLECDRQQDVERVEHLAVERLPMPTLVLMALGNALVLLLWRILQFPPVALQQPGGDRA
jgi:hypothetical protein